MEVANIFHFVSTEKMFTAMLLASNSIKVFIQAIRLTNANLYRVYLLHEDGLKFSFVVQYSAISVCSMILIVSNLTTDVMCTSTKNVAGYFMPCINIRSARNMVGTVFYMFLLI